MANPFILNEPDSYTPNTLQEFIDTVTESFVGPETVFNPPEGIFPSLKNMSFFRIRCVRRKHPSSHVPLEAIMSLAATQAPFAFIFDKSGPQVTVLMGTAKELVNRTADSVAALVGGEMETDGPWQKNTPWEKHSSWACLSGHPFVEEKTKESDHRSVADVFLDTFSNEDITMIVYVTSEPRTSMMKQVQTARRIIETIERTVLRSGTQTTIDMTALSAKELLEKVIKRADAGLSQGMCRVSVYCGGSDKALSSSAVAVLCGSLRLHEGVLVPLKYGSCGKLMTNDQLPAHHNILTVAETAGLMILPCVERSGYALTARPVYDTDCLSPVSGEIEIGRIVDGIKAGDRPFSISSDMFCKHVFVCGMTGSGKSTTIRTLLTNSAKKNIPFLVIEPAKAEYAALSALIPDTLVFAVGAPIDSEDSDRLPFLFNPFYFPKGFRLHTHIDYLKQAFIASFGLFPPTPYLLEAALYRVYENKGWDLVTGTHSNSDDEVFYPTLSELQLLVDTVVEEAGYDTEVSRNIKGALKTRIGNLCLGPKGMTLDTTDNIPEEVLFERPVVIELKHLGSDEEKALMMGIILTRMYEYLETTHQGNGSLRHLTVIEEAHRLLRKNTERSSEESNMAFHAVETFANLLAEVRAYGEGIIIAEQLPTKVIAEVVKNAGTKILHRLSPREDLNLVGDTMLLTDEQKDDAAILPPGMAIIHREGMDGPMKIAVLATGKGSARKVANFKVPELERMFYWLRERVAYVKELADKDLQRKADLILFHALGGDFADQHDNYFKDRKLLSLALRDSTKRRTLFHELTKEVREELLDLAGDLNLKELAQRFRHYLNDLSPFPLCGSCPEKCIYRYDAKILFSDSMDENITLLSGSAKNDDEFYNELKYLVSREILHYTGDDSEKHIGLNYCLLRAVTSTFKN